MLERDMNQFLRFGQNTGIGTYFTEGIHELAKEINCSLLEKVRYLLSNARLDKSLLALWNRFGLRRLCMLAIS